MPLEPHTRLGPYEIVSAIGAGGMGEVYRARDTRLNRTVAIKVLPAHLAESPEFRERLDREARAVSSLNHPHICILHDIGHQDGADFLVMEHLDGETLGARLAKGPMVVEQALQYATQIAGALAAAHRRGISHRDLKPGNIMLTKAGAKLLDFGLAKWHGDAGQFHAGTSLMATVSEGITQKGTILGTFQYMAPEQLEGKETDARSDLFAFGAVLYEMFSGRKAFEGTSQATLISSIMTSDPPPIAPPPLNRIVKKCLIKDPEDRWQSAQDLADELKWIAEAGGEPARPSSGERERILWAGACLLLLAVSIYAVLHFRSSPAAVQPIRSSLLPPPNLSYVPYNFSVSPDGLRLAFAAVGDDGTNSLWVRTLSAPGMQQVTGGEGATYPFWSPDSHSIGFFGGAKLKTVDIVGGAVRILGDAPAGLGGAWASDGTVIFAPAPGGPLLRINAAGGVPTPATTILHAASGQHHSYPALLPDGRHFLYLVDWSSPGENPGDGIYLGSLDSERPRRVFEMKGNVFFASGHLLYVRDRSLVAQPFHPGRFEFTGPAVPLAEQELDKDPGFLQSGFSASRNGVLVFQSATDSSSRLVWSESSGKVSGQITEGSFKDPHLSPDGRFLAVASDDDHNGKRFIRVLDLERGVSMRLTDDGNDEFPTWSRDGKRITYLTGAARGNSISVNEVPADGSAPPRVLLKGGMMIPNDWSPDGHLALMNLGNGPVNLAVYSAADQKLSVFSPTGAEAQFSPDGKWLAFQALGSRNGGEITVQAFPGPGARIQISNAGGAQVRWSRDGKRIYYIQPDKKLMEVNFDSARGTAGTPRTLFQTRIVAANLVLFQYDVAPDGRFLVNSFLASNSSPLTLLTGWTALLRGRSQ